MCSPEAKEQVNYNVTNDVSFDHAELKITWPLFKVIQLTKNKSFQLFLSWFVANIIDYLKKPNV